MANLVSVITNRRWVLAVATVAKEVGGDDRSGPHERGVRGRVRVGIVEKEPQYIFGASYCLCELDREIDPRGSLFSPDLVGGRCYACGTNKKLCHFLVLLCSQLHADGSYPHDPST